MFPAFFRQCHPLARPASFFRWALSQGLVPFQKGYHLKLPRPRKDLGQVYYAYKQQKEHVYIYTHMITYAYIYIYMHWPVPHSFHTSHNLRKYVGVHPKLASLRQLFVPHSKEGKRLVRACWKRSQHPGWEGTGPQISSEQVIAWEDMHWPVPHSFHTSHNLRKYVGVHPKLASLRQLFVPHSKEGKRLVRACWKRSQHPLISRPSPKVRACTGEAFSQVT